MNEKKQSKRPEIIGANVVAVEKIYKKSDAEAFNRIVSYFLQEKKLKEKQLKGFFSKEEWVGMLQSFNGTIISFDIGLSITIPPKQILLAQMEDAISLDGADTFHGFQGDKLLEKINTLSEAEVLFILEEIYIFWNTNENTSLEEFLKKWL